MENMVWCESWAHPATLEAACIALTAPHNYVRLASQMDDLLQRTELTEWSSPLVEAAVGADGVMLLPLQDISMEEEETPLTAYARQFTSLLNAVNRAMVLESPLVEGSSPMAQVSSVELERPIVRTPAQISSVEFTFQLRRTHEQHLILHVDNQVHDSRSALFIVSLRNGSMPTVLSSDPLTSCSEERCSDASDGGPVAACASDRAGAASYLPLHVCHARPPASASTGRRDVVAVHVRWSGTPPPATTVARMVHESASVLNEMNNLDT